MRRKLTGLKSELPLRSEQSRICRDFVETLDLEGLKLDTDPYAYTYNVQVASMNTDPFVRKSLKLWDKDYYRTLDGWTKKIDLKLGLEKVREYDHDDTTFDRIKNDPEALRSWDRAVRETRELFIPKEPLHRLKLKHVPLAMPLNTAAGFSFPGEKKSAVVEELQNIAQYMKHMLKAGKSCYTPPCKLAFRGHLSELSNQKVRPVWVYPGEITMLETCFSYAFYRHLDESVPAVFFGEGTFPRLYERLHRPLNGKLSVSDDKKLFDTTAFRRAVDESFNIIQDSFSPGFSSVQDFEGNVSYEADDWTPIFDYLKHYFLNTRIMLCDGTILVKKGKVPSGSMFTQIIDSLVNYIVTKFSCYVNGMDCDNLAVLGDDSDFESFHFRLPAYAESMLFYTGMVSHPDKAKIYPITVKTRSFLGYSFDGISLHRPTKEWFLRILYPERDVENVAISASRVLGLLLIGGASDERFQDFFINFMHHYPVQGREFTLSTELTRMFKYVFRYRLNLVRIPYIHELDWFSIRSFLVTGQRVFSPPAFAPPKLISC